MNPWEVLTAWTHRQVSAALAWIVLQSEQIEAVASPKKPGKPKKEPPPKTRQEAIERANKRWAFLFEHPTATVLDEQGNVIRAPTARPKSKPKG